MPFSKEQLHKAFILVAGILVILAGLVMAVPLVPGPGIIVVGLGFAILATKFPWAKRIWNRMRATGRRTVTIAKTKWRLWWYGPANTG